MKIGVTSLVLAMFAFPATHAQVRVVTDVDYVPRAEYADRKDRLDIYVPPGAQRAPVIVSFYGGALRAGDKSQETFVGQRFAKAGFVTVIPNYRLSPYVSHPSHVEDAAAAVAWVRKNIGKYGGDSTAIVVVGHSAGAYLAALLVLDQRYLAAHGMTSRQLLGVAPVSAFFFVERQGVAPDRPKDVWGTDPANWSAASPASYVRPGLPPMLLLFADGDEEWRRVQQRDFSEAVKRAGSPRVTLQMITGRTHTTVWSKMGELDDETSRAILQFITSLPARSE